MKALFCFPHRAFLSPRCWFLTSLMAMMLMLFGTTQQLHAQKRKIETTNLSGLSCTNFTVTVEKSYNPVTNKTTYTYTVTKLGRGNALSHWGFPITPCPGETITPQQFLSGAVVQTSLNKVNWSSASYSYGKDPSTAPQCTNVPVLKFNVGMENESVRYYRLIVNGNWSIIPEYAYVKFGNNCCILQIPGGGCLEEACVPPPTFTITGGPNNSPCPGATNSYSGPAAGIGETFTYKWKILSGAAQIIGADNGQNVNVKSPAVCGSYELELLVSAGVGCETKSSIIITVEDKIPPVLTVPDNISIECDQQLPGVGSASATDNCTFINPIVEYLGETRTNGSCESNYTLTRTWKATDACGNSSTKSQIITITDSKAPTITTPMNKRVACTAEVMFDAPTATDNCSGATVVKDGDDVTTPGNCAGNYTITRKWYAIDGCGNKSASVSQTITVFDEVPPTITVPADITAGECNIIRFEASAKDNCDAMPVITYSHEPGTVFPVGVTVVTVTAKDACGNTSMKTFNVTIIAKPTVTLTAPEKPYCGTSGNKLTANATGANLTYAWTVTGNGWSITAGNGTPTITYTAGSGPATFTVTVTDRYGCKASAEVKFECIAVGCSPGFWRNHKELWDNESDYVVQRMPVGLRFTINTPLHTYFGIPNGSCGLATNLTMGQAIQAQGGNCNAFVRHAVASLLSSASFGQGVKYPDGASDFTSLYNIIKQALSTCSCKGKLFNQLEAISESDHTLCDEIKRDQLITMNQPGAVSTGLSVKAFPNPYEDKIVFTINAKESGRGTLEVYNLLGQKVATVYDGEIKGGNMMNVIYYVPVTHRVNLVYIFRQNGKSESGKLISLQYFH